MNHPRATKVAAFCFLTMLAAVAPASVFAQAPQVPGNTGGDVYDTFVVTLPFNFSSKTQGTYLPGLQPPGADLFADSKAAVAADCHKQLANMEIWLYINFFAVEPDRPVITNDNGVTHYHRQIEDQAGNEAWEFSHTHHLDGFITIEGPQDSLDEIFEIWSLFYDFDYLMSLN